MTESRALEVAAGATQYHQQVSVVYESEDGFSTASQAFYNDHLSTADLPVIAETAIVNGKLEIRFL